MKKRILTAILILAVLALGIFAVSASNQGAIDPNEIANEHRWQGSADTVCPYCGVFPEGGWVSLGKDISAWQSLNGHYYTDGSCWNASYYSVLPGNKACVMLDGLSVYAEGSYAFQVEGGTLTIMGTGNVEGGYKSVSTVGATNDVVSGTLNLCGGTYLKSGSSANAVIALRGEGAVLNMYNGATIQGGVTGDFEGGNVRISAGATFNMYGGVIAEGKGYCGGNVALLHSDAKFNMYGGSIQDGKAQLSTGAQYDSEKSVYARGGNVYVAKGLFTQHNGATISGGSAYTGGNIYYEAGNTVTMAGTVTGGSGYTAGNIDLRGGSKMILASGALISNGQARYDGGNIQVYTATLEIDGGILTGGTAGRWGGSVCVDGGQSAVILRDGKLSGGETTGEFGGNIYADGSATLQLLGGTITGGKAMNKTNGRGGNLYIGDAVVKLENTAITMGQAYVSGGNIHVQSCSQGLAVKNCHIDHGAAAAGGNVYSVSTDLQLDKDTALTNGTSDHPNGSDFAGGGGNLFCYNGEVWIYGQVSGGEANLTGGNIEIRGATVYVADGAIVSDGSAGYDGGNVLVSWGILVVTDATVSGGDAGRYGANVCSYGTVVLEATAVVEDHGGVYLDKESGKLSVYTSFDGRVAVSGVEIAEPVYGVYLNENRFTSKGNFPGKLWLADLSANPVLFGKDGKLLVGAVYTSKNGVKTWYADNASAVAAYGDADFLVPSGDLVLTGGTYVVDLAGQNLTISGAGRVTCFDSSNDTYKTYGGLTMNGPVLQNKLAQTVNGKYYVRVRRNGVYSFHRMELRVSDVSLRVSSGGIYYSARWQCDDMVRPLIQGFGIGVSIADMPTENLRFDSDTKHTFHSPSEFVSGIKTNGVLISDILRDSATAGQDRVDKNSAYGKLPIYAKAYVILDNGVDREQTLISDDHIAFSLYDVLESIQQNMPHYYSAAQSLQNFKTHWAQNGLSGSEWDFDFTVPVEIVDLQQRFDSAQTLTGQLHDRLEETADLAAWKTQMEASGIDFAACLEKETLSYIGSEAWDSDAFLGGIEASFTVDGKTVDCDLLFATQAAMETVLKQSGAFTYANNAFTTKTLTRESFVSLINYVKAQGGVFVLAHPKQIGLIESQDPVAYWFADGAAVDIGTSEQNYKLWTDLLAENKRVLAISANAGALTGAADSMTLYTTGKDATQILAQLSCGDYNCGPVGMKLVIGGAVMGGSCDFTGEKLAIGVDQAPNGVLDSKHTYRIDLITASGIKASWAYTGRAVYELVDADAKQAFYRLEIVDETNGQRLAVGNPIWNNDYGLKVGFAREDVTPDYKVLITGGKQRVSKGVLENDGILLTCVAVQEGEQTILVYTADLISPSETYVASLQSAVSKATGVPFGNIIFNTTHTHSSIATAITDWSLVGEEGETNRVRFLTELNEAAIRTAQAALSDLTNVDAAYAGSVTDKNDVAFVRHYIKRDGSADYSNTGRYDVAESILQVYTKNCQYKAHATVADQEIQLVKFTREDNKKDVVLMSVPAHATLNENSEYLSADFPNYTRRYIESKTGSLVAYFIGAAGDQVPRSKLSNYYLKQTLNVSNNTDAKTYGEKLGSYAVTALQNGLPQLTNTTLQLTPAVYNGQTKIYTESRYNEAKALLESYNAGTDITSALKKKGFNEVSEISTLVRQYEHTIKNGYDMDVNIMTMAIGDLGFIFAPYEMSGANGKQIKQDSPYQNTFVATCVQDTIGYVASQDAYNHNSYEAWSSWLTEGSGELLAKRYVQVLEQMKFHLQ